MKAIPVAALRKILGKLAGDDVVAVNRADNLTVLDARERPIGFIDLAAEVFEPLV